MKRHITKKEFLNHGWKKGDNVRYIDRDNGKVKVNMVTSVIFGDYPIVTVTVGRWPFIYYDKILEIIPKGTIKSMDRKG